MARSTQSASALTKSAPPKLKDPTEKPVIPSPSDLLARKKSEFTELQKRLAETTAAQIADERKAKDLRSRDPELPALKEQLGKELHRLDSEIGLLISPSQT
jgi:hypothetical protein